MRPRRPLLLGLGLLIAALAVFNRSPVAGAAPELHSVLPITVTANALSRFGEQHIVLTGWLGVTVSQPRIENDMSVLDLQIDSLHLLGASQLGRMTVTERPDNAGRYVSRGEIRALQSGAQFPASSFIDLFVDIDAPDSPIGPLAFHNEDALRLVPQQDGVEAQLTGWPPFGVNYGLEPACVDLLDQKNAFEPLEICVETFDLGVAPGEPSFTVAPGGPLRLHPADVLGLVPSAGDATGGQAPFVRIPCASLGLTADGCDDGSDGTQDSIDGLSFGHDINGKAGVAFSVGPGAQGAPGSAVEGQDQCPPSAPGLAPEAESDVFSSAGDGTNELLFDGNGPIGTCTVGFPLGLVEAATARDNVDTFESRDVTTVDPDGDGVPDAPVYFSLAEGSPSLTALGFSAGDILVTQGGSPPRLYASAGQLGLGAGDELDDFCLREDGDLTFDAGKDVVYYTIAPRLTGATLNVGPGDILAPGTPPVVVRRASQLGLAANDNVDGLECGMVLTSAAQNGDANCDGATNAIDALLVLQLTADLLSALPCPSNGDISGDTKITSVDAALILQVSAGLIGQR